MKVAIIGHTGFVGTYIHRIYPNAECFNSKSIYDICGKSFDLIFCSGVSAVKWLANKNPIEDLKNIQLLLDCLQHVICNEKFVLISTIDVYDINKKINNEIALQNEMILYPQTTEAYGMNRYDFELKVLKIFKEKLQLIRLSALFGFGLKKNLIYDMINHRPIKIQLNNKFQWYSMEWFEQDLNFILSNKNQSKIINLFCEPITNEELLTCLPDFDNNKNNIEIIMNETNTQKIEYDIKTLYSYNNTMYWRCKNACLYAIKRFLLKLMTDNKLVVSSLTFLKTNPLLLCHDYNIQHLEIAPYSFFNNDIDFINKPLEFYEKNFINQKIYSFQSLFYPHDDWRLDQHYDLILNYLYKLIDIACIINVKILVFGAPKLRSVINAESLMILLLKNCNDYINNRPIYICIEPNAKYYKCNFLTNANDTYNFVIKKLNLSNIKMMLDTGNMFLENEDEDVLFHYINDIYHIHFSVPDLLALNQQQQQKTKKIFGFNFLKQRLYALGYKYLITMECLNITIENLNNSLYCILKDIEFEIVGAGWFGCSIATHLLTKGYQVQIFEKSFQIFNNVSSHNQNRLHLGFHYPRSFNTRSLCQSNYEKFLNQYGNFVHFIDNNCYYISHDSCLDFQTYKHILIAQNLQFEQIPIPSYLKNLYNECFKVKEGIIDFKKITKKFQNEIQTRYIYLNTECKSLEDLSRDKWILNCSYNELNKFEDNSFEDSMILIYKLTNPNCKPLGITIMDGGFWSLYPFDLTKNLYTLTHVSKGRTSNFNLIDIQNDILKYYPTFLQDFHLEDSFISKKCLMKSTCASRELQLSHQKNTSSVVCGKITGIFDFAAQIDILL